jgi:hypothetical protein
MLNPKLKNLPASTSQDQYIQLRGGLDQLTPTLSLKPGAARDARNFECSITGGYSRIAGYERFDGRPNPSDATYLTMTLNVTGALAAGDAMTGVTSAATGVVIYRSGSLVVYTKSTGTFVAAETINVGGTARATVTMLGGGEDAVDFDVRMRALAADVYRADIGQVPGSGQGRGGFYFDGVMYAFRNNAGATALALYKGTSAGWVNVAMPFSVGFSTGTNDFVEGEVVTQGANTATVKRVCLQSGSWGAGTAAGRLILTQPAPGAFAAGAATGSLGGAATLTGASAQIVLLPGGLVEFDIGTVASARRVYGIDGVNKAFEFDGTTYVPIVTGNAVDVPKRVMVHVGHLFLAFDNSVQHSGIGTPFTWTATSGAGELLADGDVMVMKRLPGDQSTGAAAICHESGTQILYGSSETDFKLAPYEDSAGAKARTGQRLGQLLVLDDTGVVSMSTTQAFGNFASSTLTLNIRPWLQARRNIATGSLLIKDKNQYRLFFSDGSGLYITIANGKMIGAMPVVFPDVVRWCCAGETPDGAETAFFGSDDGYVYRLEAGTSFDGDAIDWDLTLAFSNQKSPRQNKRYRHATLEVQGESYAAFGVAFDFAYGSTERAQQDTTTTAEVLLAPSYWDSFVWDAFTWDGRNLAPSEVSIDGSGENIAARITGASAQFEAFTLNSLILTYSPRGRKRS